FHWCQIAAENGGQVAQCNLGGCYEFGIGVDMNKMKAFEYYKKSAEHEYLYALFCFGYCYVNGIGTEVNKDKGFELYNQATGKNYNSSKIWLQYENDE